MSSTPTTGAPAKKRNLLVLLPLAGFYRDRGAVPVRSRRRRSVQAAVGADRQAGAGDQSAADCGAQPERQAGAGPDNATLNGKVSLVNVWASWCVPCHDEVPFLEQLSHDKRIQLVGINYKDAADNARRFLNRYGNPFVAAGADSNGRTAIDWGVYGVPETFLVGRDGRIAYKLVGPITAANMKAALEPEIEKALK